MTLPESAEGPFAVQVEWLDHRYDPGYFLGGTLRPELRLALGVRAKRLAAVLAAVEGLALLALAALTQIAAGVFMPDPFTSTVGLLSVLVGRRMWLAANADAKIGKLDVAEEGRRFSQVLAMVAIATAVFSILAIAALAAVVSATLLSRGHAGTAAALSVLIIVVVLRAKGRYPEG
jgi:hypothetical protein